MKILILARMTTTFNGNSVKEKPLGGSESALFYLSREMARIGHQIIIFNNCKDQAGIYEGVEYKKFTTLADLKKYAQDKDFDAFISFRDLTAFLYPPKAKKKVFWGHDDFSNVWYKSGVLKILGRAFLKFGGFLTNLLVDNLFMVSEWLSQISIKYLGIKPEKLAVLRNGVYLPYFKLEAIERNPYRLVYSSVPERGLDILLEIFPEIKKEIPEAELCIYCGMELGMLTEEDKERAKNLYQKTEQSGVKLMGTRKHAELAKELMRASLFLYPSHAVPHAGFYAETSCIAALEAQAAGVPVISSKRGAMPETVIHKETGILIEGDPFSQAYKEKIIAETIKLLKDPPRLEKMRQNAKNYIQNNYGWDKIARECEKLLSS